jgi:hypothetical protein
METEKPAPDSCAIARLLPIIFIGVEDYRINKCIYEEMENALQQKQSRPAIGRSVPRNAGGEWREGNRLGTPCLACHHKQLHCLTASFSRALFSGITIAFRKDELQHKWKSESFGSIGTNLVPRLGATRWTKLLEFRNLGCLSSE